MSANGIKQSILLAENISLTYPSNGIVACDAVSITIRTGEIHAVVGENGAGKSTLMKILSGNVIPDSGKLFLDFQPLTLHNQHEALELGIGMTHQILHVFPELTALEHSMLSDSRLSLFGALPVKKARAELKKLCDTYGLLPPPEIPVARLGFEELQKTTLLALLHRDPQVCIFDEPPHFFSKPAKQLRAEGKAVVLVTHNMHEALELADRITIMRRGTCVGTFAAAELTEHALAAYIMGDDQGAVVLEQLERNSALISNAASSSHPENSGEFFEDVDHKRDTGSLTSRKETLAVAKKPALIFKDVSGGLKPESGFGFPGSQQLTQTIRQISFTVYEGETLAVVGIKENGLLTLEKLAAGTGKESCVQTEGTILRYHTPSLQTPCAAMGYIPADRLAVGSSVQASVMENLLIHDYKKRENLRKKRGFWRLLPFPVLDFKTIAPKLQHILETFHIKGRLESTLVTLSGGNIQKLVIGRELIHHPEILICSDISWGLDIMTRKRLFSRIRRMKEGLPIAESPETSIEQDRDRLPRTAVLMLTSEIEVALAQADRIAVLRRGELVTILEVTKSLTAAEIGRYML